MAHVSAPEETSSTPQEAVSHVNLDAKPVPTPQTALSVLLPWLLKKTSASSDVAKASSWREPLVLDAPKTV